MVVVVVDPSLLPDAMAIIAIPMPRAAAVAPGVKLPPSSAPSLVGGGTFAAGPGGGAGSASCAATGVVIMAKQSAEAAVSERII